MQRKDRAEIFVSTIILELAGAIVGMVLPVGLGNCQIELALADGIQVVDGTTGTLHRAANTVLFTVHVHQTTDSTASRVINAGYTAGADGHEALLLGGNGG